MGRLGTRRGGGGRRRRRLVERRGVELQSSARWLLRRPHRRPRERRPVRHHASLHRYREKELGRMLSGETIVATSDPLRMISLAQPPVRGFELVENR